MVKSRLRKCIDCRRYTLLLEVCPHCGGKVTVPHPAKFSIDDRYIEYRVMRQ